MTTRLLALRAPWLSARAGGTGLAGRQGTPLARPQTRRRPRVGTITKGDFRFAYDDRGISSLANPEDPFGATVTTPAPRRTRRARRPGRAGCDAWADVELSRRRTRRMDELHARRAHAGGRRRERRELRVDDRPAQGRRDLHDRWARARLDDRFGGHGSSGPRAAISASRSRCRARRARHRPTSSSAASSSISSSLAPGPSFTTCARRARRHSCSSLCGRARSSSTRAPAGAEAAARCTCIPRRSRARRRAAPGGSRTPMLDLAAGQEGVVRIPDAVGVELRRAARPDLSSGPLRRPRRAGHDRADEPERAILAPHEGPYRIGAPPSSRRRRRSHRLPRRACPHTRIRTSTRSRSRSSARTC